MTKLLSDTLETVEIASLVHHPRNPRQGDVGAVVESIKANGFYGAVVVQRSTGHILIGNHRVKAAKAVGLTRVPVLYVDVDDDRALRILLSENRTNDLSSWDQAGLSSLLTDLHMTPQALTGTGYDEDALLALLNDIAKPLHVDVETCLSCGQPLPKEKGQKGAA